MRINLKSNALAVETFIAEVSISDFGLASLVQLSLKLFGFVRKASTINVLQHSNKVK